MISHVPQAFVPKELELVTQAISNCSFADLDGKSWREILPSKHSYNINIVQAIPVMIRYAMQYCDINLPVFRQKGNAIVVVDCMDHVRIIVDRSLQIRWYLHHRRLTEQDRARPYAPDGIPVGSILVHEE